METQYAVKHEIDYSGATLAITQAEAKNYCKQDLSDTEEDALFDDLIQQAVETSEAVTNRQMTTSEAVTSTFDVYEPDSNGNYVFDLKYRTSAISSFAISSAIDGDGDEVTIDSDDYELRGNRVIFRKFFLDNYRLVVTYTATEAAADLQKFKPGLLQIVANQYVERDTAQLLMTATEAFNPFIDQQEYL